MSSLQKFTEFVRHDEHLLALLECTERELKEANGTIKVTDIAHICAKILAIDVKELKFDTRRMAWMIIGRLLLKITLYYRFRVQNLLDVIEITKTTKRKMGRSKKITKQTHGGKHYILEVAEKQTNTKTVRLWQQQNEPAINFNGDLDVEDSITIQECEEPRIDRSNDEAFGENEGVLSEFSEFDENMNNIIANDHDIEPDRAIPLEEQTLLNENCNVDPTTLLADLSPPSHISEQNEKRISKKRRAVVADEEKIIPAKIMERRMTNAYIGCINRAKAKVSVSNLGPLKLKHNHLFTTPLMKGSCVRRLFGKKIDAGPSQEANDFTILDDILGNNGLTDGSNRASETLEIEASEQGEICTNDQRGINEPVYDEFVRPNTSAPPRLFAPRIFCSTPYGTSCEGSRSSVARSPSKAASLPGIGRELTPPRPFAPQVFCSTPYGTSCEGSRRSVAWSPPKASSLFQMGRELTTPRPFAPQVFCSTPYGTICESGRSSVARSSSTPASVVKDSLNRAPLEFNDDFNDVNRNNIMDDESNESEGATDYTDLMNALGQNSMEYTVISKLIRLWQKNVQPIEVSNLLKKGCNRLQAAKTFASLLILSKKQLVQMESSIDGKITHISPGAKMTMP